MKSTLISLIVGLIATSVIADDRPNILLIMVSDVGRDWVSCYGAKHQTPSVDRLAKQGVRYETVWGTPIETPSRVTLLTGQYPFRHGWTQRDDVRARANFSWTKFTSFARILRDSGYATAVGGKWQINHLEKQPGALKHHGFDEHCVWVEADSDGIRGAKLDSEKAEPHSGNCRIITNGVRATTSDGPEAINSFLINFIKRKRAKPFLVYCPMPLAYGPHANTPRNNDNGPEGKEARYAGKVTLMDQLVGKLIGAVDSAGLGHNTLVVFTSDNGSEVAGKLNGKSFEKGKGRGADVGAHVPFIVRAPFLTSGNRVSRDLLDFTDLYPTFLELAKTAPPKGTMLDGRSFVPSLRGSEDPFEKRNWIFSQVGDFRMIRDWQHILDSEGKFHDLTKDPLQKNEVSPLDKIAPGRRQRLEMLLKRFPPDAAAPYSEFRE